MFFPWCLTLSLTVLICSLNLGCAATLATDEVDALQQIADTLGKKDWNFTMNPCSQGPNDYTWVDQVNQVICNCSFNSNTTCHVTEIRLTRQNLSGIVPPELVRLPYLQNIDLSYNYLNGTIPPEWGTMQQLEYIFLRANRVTGQIPSELANISALKTLDLECNQLSGNIPPEFGNFSSIEKIRLSSNNLSGELPATLERLTKLAVFRISDNNFSGNIPKFIGNWTSIETLLIQGSGLSGPIPSGIASMTNLSDLRISDLNGKDESTLPPVLRYSKLEILILRSCNIIGQLPSDIWETNLYTLDLSFNKLGGPISDNFSPSSNLKYIYLTGNLLTGPVPTWMQNGRIQIDLSYNNLKSESTDQNCQDQTLNLFASSKGNTTGIVSCLRSSSCDRKYYSLHINCGGAKVKDDDDGTPYEADTATGGASNFERSLSNWVFSSTGHFLDSDSNLYIKANTSSISGKKPQLYMNARVSPLSLSYYGFCLGNGNYTISLHFAEIAFTEDRTYNCLGRRLFDVYIQGKRVLKDFNIEDEANGVNIGIVKNVSAVVDNNTLDIRFYWAGRGTNSIPYFGEYGPLISAISVNPSKL